MNTAPPTRSDELARAWRALDAVKDPEIPVISVVDMGMIADVRREVGGIVVDMTPTFVGCPALDVIKADIRGAIEGLGHEEVSVRVVYDPPWTTERITDRGRRQLKEFGLAPPGPTCGGGMPKLDAVPCPLCDSTDTALESIFGPTLCRSIHYCNACLQSFEHFKQV